MHHLNISFLSVILFQVSTFLLVTEGQASILISPLRRQRAHRGIRTLRITPQNPQSSGVSIHPNGDNPNQINNAFQLPETTSDAEWLSQDDPNRALITDSDIRRTYADFQVVTRTRAIILKQQRREQVKQEREISHIDNPRDSESLNVRSKSLWWSRGKEGLQWKRNRDTGIPEVVELHDE